MVGSQLAFVHLWTLINSYISNCLNAVSLCIIHAVAYIAYDSRNISSLFLHINNKDNGDEEENEWWHLRIVFGWLPQPSRLLFRRGFSNARISGRQRYRLTHCAIRTLYERRVKRTESRELIARWDIGDVVKVFEEFRGRGAVGGVGI